MTTKNQRTTPEDSPLLKNWKPDPDQMMDQGMAISVERALRRMFSEELNDNTEQPEKTQ